MEITEHIKKLQLKGDQKDIAETIVSNLHRTAFLSGPELAKECQVSVSAITRFAQKLGYTGFPDFKKALEVSYRQTITPYEMFESFVKNKNAATHEISITQDLENIQRMQANFDLESFEAATKLLYKSKKIHITAIGSSEILVDYSAAFLQALNKPVNPLKSFGVTKLAEISDFHSTEVLIGFSFQRIMKEVQELFKYVKQFGVKTIAVTDSPINPLAIEADVTLVTPVVGATFGLSLVAPLTMVNMLSNSVASYDQKKSLQVLKKAKKEWETRPIFCGTKAKLKGKQK